MRDEDGRDLWLGLQRVADVVGAGRLAPFVRQHRDVGAVLLGDRGEALPESADADGEDLVARRERVDDGGFEPAGAGAG